MSSEMRYALYTCPTKKRRASAIVIDIVSDIVNLVLMVTQEEVALNAILDI